MFFMALGSEFSKNRRSWCVCGGGVNSKKKYSEKISFRQLWRGVGGRKPGVTLGFLHLMGLYRSKKKTCDHPLD